MSNATFRLRECRERAGMSVETLAFETDLYPWLVRTMESDGLMPTWAQATDIATALGCTLDELAGIEQPDSRQAT